MLFNINSTFLKLKKRCALMCVHTYKQIIEMCFKHYFWLLLFLDCNLPSSDYSFWLASWLTAYICPWLICQNGGQHCSKLYNFIVYNRIYDYILYLTHCYSTLYTTYYDMVQINIYNLHVIYIVHNIILTHIPQLMNFLNKIYNQF